MPRARAERMIRSAISPRLATSRVLLVMSHPEDAVGGIGERAGLCGDREPHAEHPAGVSGVDDAVVPQPGGGVVRRPLPLVLVEDRGLELRLLVLAPLAAARLDAVAADGRQ